jgi:hypothetical protein
MTNHDFALPFPDADLERCRNCGAGKGSPVGNSDCRPVKAFQEFRQRRDGKS